MEIYNNEKIEAFNSKQKVALKRILERLNDKIENVECYVGFWKKDGTFVIGGLDQEEHNFLNYYWCEYQKGGEQYRITMFYKDFDHGSGNIHVLPGAIQVWKKSDKSCFDELGFCQNELEKMSCKVNRQNDKCELLYVYAGGEPYCEFGWMPLLEKPLFWDDDILDEFISNLAKDIFTLGKNQIFSNVFYKDVKDYSTNGRSGHYMKYSLLKFEGNSLYYKTEFIENFGFFTKYDGEEIRFENGNQKNSCGPNYYDEHLHKWVIHYYDEKQKEWLLK